MRNVTFANFNFEDVNQPIYVTPVSDESNKFFKFFKKLTVSLTTKKVHLWLSGLRLLAAEDQRHPLDQHNRHQPLQHRERDPLLERRPRKQYPILRVIFLLLLLLLLLVFFFSSSSLPLFIYPLSASDLRE